MKNFAVLIWDSIGVCFIGKSERFNSYWNNMFIFKSIFILWRGIEGINSYYFSRIYILLPYFTISIDKFAFLPLQSSFSTVFLRPDFDLSNIVFFSLWLNKTLFLGILPIQHRNIHRDFSVLSWHLIICIFWVLLPYKVYFPQPVPVYKIRPFLTHNSEPVIFLLK